MRRRAVLIALLAACSKSKSSGSTAFEAEWKGRRCDIGGEVDVQAKYDEEITAVEAYGATARISSFTGIMLSIPDRKVPIGTRQVKLEVTRSSGEKVTVPLPLPAEPPPVMRPVTIEHPAVKAKLTDVLITGDTVDGKLEDGNIVFAFESCPGISATTDLGKITVTGDKLELRIPFVDVLQHGKARMVLPDKRGVDLTFEIIERSKLAEAYLEGFPKRPVASAPAFSAGNAVTIIARRTLDGLELYDPDKLTTANVIVLIQQTTITSGKPCEYAKDMFADNSSKTIYTHGWTYRGVAFELRTGKQIGRSQEIRQPPPSCPSQVAPDAKDTIESEPPIDAIRAWAATIK